MRQYRRSSDRQVAADAGAIALDAAPEAADARNMPDGAQAQAAKGSFLLLLFLASLLIPVRIYLGDLLFSPSRLFLLIVFVPLFLRLVSGGAGRIQPVDIMIFLYCAWIAISLGVNEGMARIAFTGISTVELFGGYLVGRTLVRSDMDYRAFFRYFAWGLLFLLPFVLFEQLTRRMLLSELLGRAFETFKYVNYDQRMGLNRVQAVFEHPILFGLFCSVGIGNFYYLNRDRPARAVPLTSLAVFMTFMAMSSAALLSSVMQLGMVLWDRVTKSKWVPLAVLAVIFYVVVDLLSNRSPVQVLISYATFNSGSAYNRLLIWRYGTQNVIDNPIFGIGLGDWERIWWMKESVDNFWLLNAMRYGIPGVSFLMGGIAWSFWRILAVRNLSAGRAQCRDAYAVTAAGLFFTLSTVHVWGATSVLFMFYIGAGVWLAQTASAAQDAAPAARAGATARRAAPERQSGGHRDDPPSEPAPRPARAASGARARDRVRRTPARTPRPARRERE